FSEGGLSNQFLIIAPTGSTLVAIATGKVLHVGIPTKVPEPWDIGSVGLSSLIVFVIKTFKFATGTNQEMVVHDVSAQLVGVVPQSVREPVRFGLHQNGSGGNCRGTKENDLCLELEHFFGFPIDHLDT